jgi:hypothetical protein
MAKSVKDDEEKQTCKIWGFHGVISQKTPFFKKKQMFTAMSVPLTYERITITNE